MTERFKSSATVCLSHDQVDLTEDFVHGKAPDAPTYAGGIPVQTAHNCPATSLPANMILVGFAERWVPKTEMEGEVGKVESMALERYQISRIDVGSDEDGEKMGDWDRKARYPAFSYINSDRPCSRCTTSGIECVIHAVEDISEAGNRWVKWKMKGCQHCTKISEECDPPTVYLHLDTQKFNFDAPTLNTATEGLAFVPIGPEHSEGREKAAPRTGSIGLEPGSDNAASRGLVRGRDADDHGQDRDTKKSKSENDDRLEILRDAKYSITYDESTEVLRARALCLAECPLRTIDISFPLTTQNDVSHVVPGPGRFLLLRDALLCTDGPASTVLGSPVGRIFGLATEVQNNDDLWDSFQGNFTASPYETGGFPDDKARTASTLLAGIPGLPSAPQSDASMRIETNPGTILYERTRVISKLLLADRKVAFEIPEPAQDASPPVDPEAASGHLVHQAEDAPVLEFDMEKARETFRIITTLMAVIPILTKLGTEFKEACVNALLDFLPYARRLAQLQHLPLRFTPPIQPFFLDGDVTKSPPRAEWKAMLGELDRWKKDILFIMARRAWECCSTSKDRRQQYMLEPDEVKECLQPTPAGDSKWYDGWIISAVVNALNYQSELRHKPGDKFRLLFPHAITPPAFHSTDPEEWTPEIGEALNKAEDEAWKEWERNLRLSLSHPERHQAVPSVDANRIKLSQIDMLGGYYFSAAHWGAFVITPREDAVVVRIVDSINEKPACLTYLKQVIKHCLEKQFEWENGNGHLVVKFEQDSNSPSIRQNDSSACGPITTLVLDAVAKGQKDVSAKGILAQVEGKKTRVAPKRQELDWIKFRTLQLISDYRRELLTMLEKMESKEWTA